MLIGLLRDDKDGSQFKRLRAQGCTIIEDSLERVRDRLSPGDTIVVTALDRLYMQEDKLYEFIRFVLEKRRANLRVLDGNLDTAGPFREYTLNFLKRIEEAAASVRVERRRRFIDQLKENGKLGGRPKVMSRERFLRAYHYVESGQVTERGLIFLLGIHRATYYRWKKKVLGSET